MDGIYMTKVSTPMGTINGRLTLVTSGSQLSGSIEAMGMKSEFSNGIINGNTCKFSGIIRSMIGNISYEAVGTVVNGQMKLVANTNKGKFEFVGQRQ